jgi:ribonuclease HI
LEAIDLAQKNTNQDEIWVFSDSHSATKQILENWKGRFRLIEEEFEITPAESMMLQSLGISNITANSTFSAWAAALNDRATQRICPQTYFQDNRETPNWPPKGWTPIASKWE